MRAGDQVGFQQRVELQQQVRGQAVILVKVRHQGQVQVRRVENGVAAWVRSENTERGRKKINVSVNSAVMIS